MHQVIYLTGPPASGKTTLLNNVAASRTDVAPFSYGEVLTQIAKRRADLQNLSQEDVRRESASLVWPEDVLNADAALVAFVAERKASSHVIVDSHPVTKEKFGFRVTAYGEEALRRVGFTRLCCLYCDPEVARARIPTAPSGRPLVTAFEAAMHTHLQASVVATYGVLLGLPVYYLDSGQDPASLVGTFCDRVLRV